MGKVGYEPEESSLSELPSLIAAAHELKSPLVLLRQLSFELETTDDPVRRSVLGERLRFTTEQSLRLVEQLSVSSRLDDVLFDTEPLQIQALYQDLESQLQPLAAHLGVELDVRLPRRPLVTVANRDLLPALMRNFCDNALTYTPQGGKVVIRASERHNKICLSVRDDGPTISHQAFRQLQQKLGRAPQPLTSRPRSSGLGLWIAGVYADYMSAQLQTRRHRRGGMTFSVELPKSEQMALL